MSAPGKNGAPTGFALGYLGKKGVNSDFISIHEEPPVILYIALLSLMPSLSVLLWLVSLHEQLHAVRADDPHVLGAPDDSTALGTYPPPGAALCFGGLGSSGLTAAGCFAACSGASHIRPCQPLTHLDILPALEDDKVQQLLGWARDGPAVFLVVVDSQAVCLGLLLKADRKSVV